MGEIVKEILNYIIREGFNLVSELDATHLLLGNKVCYNWMNVSYSAAEMVLVMYAELVQPPLTYN